MADGRADPQGCQVPKFADRGFVGHRLIAKINTHEVQHGAGVVQRLLGATTGRQRAPCGSSYGTFEAIREGGLAHVW